MRRLVTALVVVNLILLALVLSPLRRAFAQPRIETVASVLRARSLEIVDERGRTRAQILVIPATVRDGVAYPDSVLFRLIDTAGQPSVKMAVSSEGSGLNMLGGPDDNGWYGMQVTANAQGGAISLVDKQGRRLDLKP